MLLHLILFNIAMQHYDVEIFYVGCAMFLFLCNAYCSHLLNQPRNSSFFKKDIFWLFNWTIESGITEVPCSPSV